MNCWETLGVSEDVTVEQLQITYYNKLRHYSAISDKKKREELKKAYDEAFSIMKCDKKDETFSEFLAEVNSLYDDFPRRIKLENWRQLIEKYYNDDEIFNISCELLEFLQTHKHLPHEIWKYFNDKFKWKYFRNELYLKFPKEFMDFVLKYSRKELYIDYNRISADNSDVDYDGFIEAMMNATDAIVKGKVGEAQHHINIAREKYPCSLDLKIIFIRYKKLKNELDRCIELCNMILPSCPEEKSIYTIRGDAYLKKNELDKAYEDFHKAMELKPVNNEDYYNMALVCFLLKKTEESKQYIGYIKDDYVYTSLSKELNKDIDRLIKDIELPAIISAINKNPLDFELYRKAYDIYYNTGEYDNAYNLVNNLSKIKQLDCNLYVNQAKVCMELRKMDEALLAAYNANNQEPDNLESIIILADVLAGLNKNEEAINKYDTALVIKPYDDEIVQKKTLSLYNMGRFKEAYEYCKLMDKKNEENNRTNSEKLSNLITALLIELEKYPQAMQNCRTMLNYNSSSSEAWLNKIKLYNRLGKSQDVMDMLHLISHISENDCRFIYEKASAMYNMSMIAEAEDICKKLTDDKYIYYGPYYLLAKMCYSNKKNKNALKYSLMALEKSPCNVKIILIVGKCYKLNGDRKNALEYVNKAIEQDSNYVNAYIERINLYMDDKKYQEAMEDANICLKLKESSVLYVKLGVLNEIFGNEPVKFYNKSIEMDKKNAEAYLNRGIYYAKVGKHKDAFQDFDTVINIDSSSPLPYYQKGNIFMKSGKMSEAMEEYNIAVKLGVADCDIYTRLGECYRARNNYKMAIEYCNKAIEKDISAVDAYRIRAISLYNISQFKNALQDLEVCISSDSINNSSKAGIYKYRAYCYKKLNDMNKTDECFKKALELDPGNINLKSEYEQFSKENSGFGKLKGIFKKN